jgi:hypothetical protein
MKERWNTNHRKTLCEICKAFAQVIPRNSPQHRLREAAENRLLQVILLALDTTTSLCGTTCLRCLFCYLRSSAAEVNLPPVKRLHFQRNPLLDPGFGCAVHHTNPKAHYHPFYCRYRVLKPRKRARINQIDTGGC